VGDAGGDEEDVKPKAKKLKAEKVKLESQLATPLPRLTSELAGGHIVWGCQCHLRWLTDWFTLPATSSHNVVALWTWPVWGSGGVSVI